MKLGAWCTSARPCTTFSFLVSVYSAVMRGSSANLARLPDTNKSPRSPGVICNRGATSQTRSAYKPSEKSLRPALKPSRAASSCCELSSLGGMMPGADGMLGSTGIIMLPGGIIIGSGGSAPSLVEPTSDTLESFLNSCFSDSNNRSAPARSLTCLSSCRQYSERAPIM